MSTPSGPATGPPTAAVAVIIPALNEAKTITTVVADTLAVGIDLVVVVDNGSTDETASNAASAGAMVVAEPRRGYGQACFAGTTAAIEAGAEILVYMDGDQSCRPSETWDLVAPIAANEADLVLGSRMTGTIEPGAMPSHQRFGNWLTARLMRRLYGLQVTDLGPFRAISAALVEDLDMSEMTFGWPTEMMVKTARRNATTVEIPVSWDRRAAGTSKVSGTVKGSILAAWHILTVTARYARHGQSA